MRLSYNSHDIVPLTKSTPCCHFGRHSCMKGDDCPFDHQLSKYPCANFVSQGSCGRGDACLFSHQVPTEKGIPTLSNVSRRELKKSPSVSGNTNSCMQINNGGCNPTQQSHFFNSMATHSPINAEHTGTSSVQKKPIAPPKGISFLNVAKPSLLSPSTLKQGMVSANKTNADQSASGTNKASAGIPKKSPALTPKGIKFLSFGKGSVCSFKSSSSSLLNRESGKLQQVSSSLNNDAYSKVYSHGDRSHGKSVQGGKRAVDSSLTSTLTSSSMLLVSPSVSNQPLASSSSQRAMISTLAFAAEHESDIKMKSLRGEQGSSSILFNWRF
ncbi:hypothetical protein RIF29_25955 [Crotalaria pallida]|uniref:C3H1-type domain-containing protein n=1 Tax=Crotalaria pallida TaxID=3830 RepID=A0AAN9EMU5_CROPI